MTEPIKEEPDHIIVIGASAGGMQSLIELMAQVTEEMNSAIFVVLHTPNLPFGNAIVKRIQKNCIFTCKLAEHEETIKAKHLYLAVPDKHLLLKEGKILLGSGPLENRWRPSIDVLFRSAAVAYDSRTIGVILSGLLEDGTTGMQMIKSCGGTCIVQDPAEAEYPDMPQSVLRHVEVDYCTTLQRIAILLQEKTRSAAEPVSKEIPPQIRKEAEIAERVMIGIENVAELGGEKVSYSCPDCGGGLWEIRNGNILRYRCHTGHMYTANELQDCKRQELEQTFWVVLRILEERKNLLLRMADEEKGKGWLRSAALKTERSEDLQVHINRIREILFETTDDEHLTFIQENES